MIGQCNAFGIAWPGTGDCAGAILSRAPGLNAGLLNPVSTARFDNIDACRYRGVFPGSTA